MADKYLSNWDALVFHTNNAAEKILKEYVAPVAEDILRRHIQTDIYDAYTPKTNGWVSSDGKRETYQRRHVLERAVRSVLEDDNTLLVTSTARPSPSVVKGHNFINRYDGSFLELIQSGHTGIWKGGFPRPAVRNTEADFKDFDKGKRLGSVIQYGIRREIEIVLHDWNDT